MPNKVAVSLTLPDTDECLAQLDDLAGRVALAEIRIDLMEHWDLPRLVRATPCPLIITCRPQREGGRFAGSEEERIQILTQAIDLGCTYVDVEWDSLPALAAQRSAATRLIVSRHWFTRMPADLWPSYEALRAQADVVKLVGIAHNASDMLPIFDLLRRATTAVIAIAMGEAGQLTRLLAPCFPACLLTYGAVSTKATTAAGQLTIEQMLTRYHLHQIGPHTAVELHLCANDESAAAVVLLNAEEQPGTRLHVPLVITPGEADVVLTGMRACLPQLNVTVDPT